jgi:hypothetical protein
VGRHSRPSRRTAKLHLGGSAASRLGVLAATTVALTGATFAAAGPVSAPIDPLQIRSLQSAAHGSTHTRAGTMGDLVAHPRPPQPTERKKPQRDRRERASRHAPRAILPGCPQGAATSYANGQLPDSALCDIPGGGRLRSDAARAFFLLNVQAERVFGSGLCVGSTYRTYAEQGALYAQKPSLAAPPGSSNHGYGTAIDFCGAGSAEGTSVHEWLQSVGPRFGWVLPGWAQAGGSRPEPWHFEYLPELDGTRV